VDHSRSGLPSTPFKYSYSPFSSSFSLLCENP
jgi:hypothetical protein